MLRQMFARMMRFLVAKVIRPRWIVATSPPEARGEMGILILGVPCFYYKWQEPMYAEYTWRLARKREFGETVRSTQEFFVHESVR